MKKHTEKRNLGNSVQLSNYVDKKNKNDYERISSWTLRIMGVLAIIMFYLVVTGRIDQWLG